MPAKNVLISIDHKIHSIKPGALRGQDIINLAHLNPSDQVLLEVSGDMDIPLFAEDLLFIRGSEKFSIGDGNPAVSDNPHVRKPLDFILNDSTIPENQRPHHPKITGAELKTLAGTTNADLWIDLDGLADEIIEDSDRIIIQSHDRFFTVPREEEDRFYEVTVLLDGEDRELRFPAAMTVREAIRRCLPPADRPNVNDFDMVDCNIGTSALNPDLTLKSAGVRDEHILSITKKNGGGG